MSDRNPLEYMDACKALQRWMVSQDLQPHEGVLICEMMIAFMIAINSKSADDIERKLRFSDTTIREVLAAVAVGILKP